MIVNIEGTKVEFNVVADEDRNNALEEVFAILGFDQRPHAKDCDGETPVHMLKQIPVDEKAGYVERVNLLDIVTILGSRFNIEFDYKDNLDIVCERMEKIFCDPQSAAMITRQAVLEYQKTSDLATDMLEFIKIFDRCNDASISIDMKDKKINILESGNVLASFGKDGRVEIDSTAPKKFIEYIKTEFKDTIVVEKFSEANVTVLPPDKKEPPKILRKSIESEPVKEKRETANGKVIEINNKDKNEIVKVIHNPETTITLANTEQIATRIDIELLGKYINIDSLKNIPFEFKAKVMARLEGALQTVLKSKDAHKLLNKNEKYGISKSNFFSKDVYSLFNGKRYMKFIDAENFVFDTKLN
jgi:hypothetical protein